MTDLSANALMRPAENPQTRFGQQPSAAPGFAPRLGGNPLMTPPAANPLAQPQPAALAPPSAPEAGSSMRISTRIPNAAAHDRQDLGLSHAEMRPNLDNPETPEPEVRQYHQAIDGVRKAHPHVNMANMRSDDAAEQFIRHGHDNISWLYRQVQRRPWAEDAKNTYRNANREAGSLASEHGVEHHQAAATIAALSPHKDLHESINLADRAMTIAKNHRGEEFTPEMRAQVQHHIDASPNHAVAAKFQDHLDAIGDNAQLKDLDHPMQQAMFVRAFDERPHDADSKYKFANDRSHPIISPRGERIAAPEKRTTWGSYASIANAMKALKSPEMGNISRSLGVKPKVRSLYNNIVAPDALTGDVTIDNDAIKAANMMPVHHGLNASYALHADAYRRAAQTMSRLEGRRILPNEVQSVASEAARGLFSHPAMSASGAEGEPAHDVGKAAKYLAILARHHAVGPTGPYRVTPAMQRVSVRNAAGGIDAPPWWQLRGAR